MKSLLNLFFITLLSTLSITSVSYSEVQTRDSFQCNQFYHLLSRDGRKLWHRPEPIAIGDGDEPRYRPKGRVRELEETEVSNQCQTYECYLFSVINYINVYNKTRLQKKAALISEPYLVAHKFLEHIKEGLRYGIEDPRLIHDLEGGYSYEAFHLTRKVGLVPKRSWHPRIPFDEWDMTKIYRVLKRKVPFKHEELKKLAKSHGWESAIVKQAREQEFDDLKNIILDFTGPLPTEFNFNDRRYNPLKYEREFGLPRFTDLLMHYKIGEEFPANYPWVLRQAITNEDGHYRVIPGDKHSLVLSVKKYINMGLPVIMDVNWKGDGHSMLIVGYEEADAGQIVRYKVMNSWGPDFGNSGYAWYTPADVWKNITGTYRFELPIAN